MYILSLCQKWSYVCFINVAKLGCMVACIRIRPFSQIWSQVLCMLYYWFTQLIFYPTNQSVNSLLVTNTKFADNDCQTHCRWCPHNFIETDCSQDQLMVTPPAVRQYITALQTSSQCLSIHTTHTVDCKMLKWKLRITNQLFPSY